MPSTRVNFNEIDGYMEDRKTSVDLPVMDIL